MHKRMSWWDKVIQGGQHTSFRLLSLIFSGASAWAIYWFFQALGDDPVQHVFTVLTSVGFVALGYFVTRGLAHRMMNKQRVRSYIPLALLYIVVEVSCNFAHAAAKYPEVAWIQQLHGWQLTFFSFMLPFVLSIIPLFNIFLANIDVDLMQEKGIVAAGSLVGPQPKNMTNYGAGLSPQVSYPSMPAPPVTNGKQQGGQNALKSWWAGQRAGASSASGLSPSARNNLQAASSNGMNAGIP